MGVLAYANNLSGPFIFDDRFAILENESIRQLWSGSWWRTPSGGSSAEGRPVGNLTLAINYAIGKWDVRGYHVVNITVHILCALVLYGVVRRTLQAKALRARFGPVSAGLAGACGLIWMVHPIQTECVNYITQRFESLMGLFYLLTLYSAIRAIDSDHSVRWGSVSVAFCALGMATKEVMVTAPLMVLLYDRVFAFGSLRQAWRARWRLYAGLAATWVILVTLMAAFPQSQSEGFHLGVSAWDYALNQCVVIVHYLRLTVWPYPLILDYGQAGPVPITRAAPHAAVLVLLLTTTVVALVYRPMMGFLGAWFFIILGPTSSFIPLVTEVGAERRMYLPLAGLVVLLVVGGYLALQQAARWFRTREGTGPRTAAGRWEGRVGSVLLIALAGVLTCVTVRRNEDYHSKLSIWETAVAAAPDNPRGHYNLGVALQEQGRLDEAIRHYRQAVQLRTDYPDAHNNLGRALSSQDKWEEAIYHYRQALKVQPNYAIGHNNLGNALSELRRFDEAIRHYRRALEIAPGNALTHYNLGNVLLTQNRPDEAISHYRQALQIKPGYAEAHNNLGLALRTTGRVDEALESFRAAVRLRPEDPAFLNNLAWTLATHPEANVQEAHEAIGLAERAAVLTQRRDATVLDTLAAAYASGGQFDRAVTTAQEAIDSASATQNHELVNQIRQRLERYRQSQPYREPLPGNGHVF
jgi:tetratricopeptide (TPR) repeat protein